MQRRFQRFIDVRAPLRLDTVELIASHLQLILRGGYKVGIKKPLHRIIVGHHVEPVTIV